MNFLNKIPQSHQNEPVNENEKAFIEQETQKRINSLKEWLKPIQNDQVPQSPYCTEKLFGNGSQKWKLNPEKQWLQPLNNDIEPKSPYETIWEKIQALDPNNSGNTEINDQEEDDLPKRVKDREKDIENAINYLLKHYHFVNVASKKLLVFNGRWYEELVKGTPGWTVLKDCLREYGSRAMSRYNEIYNQLLTDKSIWIDHIEKLPTNKNKIVFANGTYDILEAVLHRDFYPEDYALSCNYITYEPDAALQKTSVTKRFVDFFCNGDARKEQLLFEILGFCMSAYENQKACFFFLGVPNAGKSVLCNFVRLVVGADAYISIPIKDLDEKFNTGELVNKKVCADEDVAIMAPLTTNDLSMIKKISSSDMIQTNGKYQQLGYIRPTCRLLWAANGFFKFATHEDLTPFAERLVIFPLENAIPEEERDPDIIDKLMEERNYIIYRALLALRDLVQNNFRFTKVVDAWDYIAPTGFVDGIPMFIDQCCKLDPDISIASSSLYEAYKQFCLDHSEYRCIAQNSFSSRVMELYNVTRDRNSSTRFLKGICLKE